MTTTEAIQYLMDEVSKMKVDFFAIERELKDATIFTTYFNTVELALEFKGISSTTTAPSLNFELSLGSYHPPGVPTYNIWIYEAKDDSALNRAAMVTALETMLDVNARTSRVMFYATA